MMSHFLSNIDICKIHNYLCIQRKACMCRAANQAFKTAAFEVTDTDVRQLVLILFWIMDPMRVMYRLARKHKHMYKAFCIQIILLCWKHNSFTQSNKKTTFTVLRVCHSCFLCKN